MTPAVPSLGLAVLSAGAAAIPPATGVVVLAVLVLALVVKVALQTAHRFPRTDALQLLSIMIAPLLVVFIIVVVERFRDLS